MLIFVISNVMLTFCIMCCGLIPNSAKSKIVLIWFSCHIRGLVYLPTMAARPRTLCRCRLAWNQSHPIRFAMGQGTSHRIVRAGHLNKGIASGRQQLQVLRCQTFGSFCKQVRVPNKSKNNPKISQFLSEMVRHLEIEVLILGRSLSAVPVVLVISIICHVNVTTIILNQLCSATQTNDTVYVSIAMICFARLFNKFRNSVWTVQVRKRTRWSASAARFLARLDSLVLFLHSPSTRKKLNR